MQWWNMSPSVYCEGDLNMQKGGDFQFNFVIELMLAKGPVKIFVARSLMYFPCCSKSVQTSRSVM